MNKVFIAERYGDMSSLGNASGVLLRQYNFPYCYENIDILVSADHDRCFQWDYNNARKACEKHMQTGELAMSGWVKHQTPSNVMSFFSDFMKTEEHYPSVVWTGFRLLGTVNRGNGYPVFSMQLFCNKSCVEVYSDDNAPNVKFGKFETMY